MARDLYAFIGVDGTFDYQDAHKKALPASQARFPWLASGVKKGARVVRKLGFPGVVGRVKGGPLSSWLYKPLEDNDISMSDEDRDWLYDYYKADVRAVAASLNVDLGGWLR